MNSLLSSAMALVESAVPKSTRYKNKWDYGIFEQWQKEILIKVPNVEVSGLFKDYDFHLVESLDTSLIEMIALRSLNYWLSKFVQEVAKSSSERYPPRKVNGIIAGIRRYLPEKKPGDDLNLLSTSDNR